MQAKADHIVLDAPQGSLQLKPDADGVFSVPEMNFSFTFEPRGEDDMVIVLLRGKDRIEMKRK